MPIELAGIWQCPIQTFLRYQKNMLKYFCVCDKLQGRQRRAHRIVKFLLNYLIFNA